MTKEELCLALGHLLGHLSILMQNGDLQLRLSNVPTFLLYADEEGRHHGHVNCSVIWSPLSEGNHTLWFNTLLSPS